MTRSPSSLLVLLIFSSARSIDHVGDLYPVSFFASVRWFSYWMTVTQIRSCPGQTSFLYTYSTAVRDYPPSWRLYACSEALYSFRSGSTNLFLQQERISRILTYPPSGCDSIPWSVSLRKREALLLNSFRQINHIARQDSCYMWEVNFALKALFLDESWWSYCQSILIM